MKLSRKSMTRIQFRRWIGFVAVVVVSCYKSLDSYSVLESSDRELSAATHYTQDATAFEGSLHADMAARIELKSQNDSTSSSRTTLSTTNQYHDAITLPTRANTVIAAIAMGDTAQSNIAERFIASIRRRGNFDGYILLLTDAAGLDKYKRTLVEGDNSQPHRYYKDAIIHDDTTIVVPVWEKDTNPIDTRTRRPIQFNGHMKYKRLKTVFDKYVNAYVDSRLRAERDENDQHSEKIRFVLYLDIDNVVANPLDDLFRDYYNTVGTKLEAVKNEIAQQSTNGMSDTNDNKTTTQFSFFSMWKEPTKEVDGEVKEWRWQGGQILQDRHYSKGCADAWRQQFDTHPKRRMDQGLFNNIVVQNFEEYRCKVLELPTEHKIQGEVVARKHYDKLDDGMLALPVEQLPTVIHITSRRTQDLDVTEQKQFLRKALGIGNEREAAAGSSDNQQSMNWDRIISVVNGKGVEY